MKVDQGISWDQVKRHRMSLIAASAVILALICVQVFWLSPIWSSNGEWTDRIAQQRELILKYQDKLAKSKDLKDKLGSQEVELSNLQKKLFRGDDSYQLAATLGELFASKGTKDLNMKSYQVLASKEYGLYQEVQLKFDFTASVKGLYHFLQGLQSSPTAILVQQLRIQRVQRKVGHDLVISVVLTALMESAKKT